MAFIIMYIPYQMHELKLPFKLLIESNDFEINFLITKLVTVKDYNTNFDLLLIHLKMQSLFFLFNICFQVIDDWIDWEWVILRILYSEFFQLIAENWKKIIDFLMWVPTIDLYPYRCLLFCLLEVAAVEEGSKGEERIEKAKDN